MIHKYEEVLSKIVCVCLGFSLKHLKIHNLHFPIKINGQRETYERVSIAMFQGFQGKENVCFGLVSSAFCLVLKALTFLSSTISRIFSSASSECLVAKLMSF